MNYQHYTSEDFALDEKFQQWVLNPDKENSTFWDNWCRQYPEKQKQVAEAIELVHKAGLSVDSTANRAFLEVWEHVRNNAHTNTKQRRLHVGFRYGRMAAVWAVFILVGTFL